MEGEVMEPVMEYVKAVYVPDDTGYHTAGKVYEFRRDALAGRRPGGTAMDDNGTFGSYILLTGCAHLNGADWTLCTSDGTPL